MGQRLTFEIGRLNIGRSVKAMPSDGHGGGKGATEGTLIEATRDHAVIQIPKHPVPVKIEWSRVQDWTSRNSGPLVLPPAASAAPPVKVSATATIAAAGRPTTTLRLTPTEAAEPKPLPAPAPEPAPAPPTPPTPREPADAASGFDSLDRRIEAGITAVLAAEESVDAALEMYWEAKRHHDEAVKALEVVKGEADAIMQRIADRIGSHLAGTKAAPVPTPVRSSRAG